jgi:TPP-dependent pyruvate/acetoin dehydrogenase alpha subunit
MDVPDDLELFTQMCFLRHFEERTDALYRQGLIHGPVHLGLGQEAIAVGAASVLRPGDYSLGTYRGHAHALARGAPPDAVLAELLGKTGGICGGKGGSMHITSVEHGYLFGRQCAGLQAGGEGGRARAWSDGTFRLLDVLAQDGDGRATDRSGAGP